MRMQGIISNCACAARPPSFQARRPFFTKAKNKHEKTFAAAGKAINKLRYAGWLCPIDARGKGCDPFSAIETVVPWDVFLTSYARSFGETEPTRATCPPPHRPVLSEKSAVNQVVSKRMVKKQQMRWTKSGAHNLLQVRTNVLNDQLRETFVRWYPGMQTEQETEIERKAA
jgi:hypothetical protein